MSKFSKSYVERLKRAYNYYLDTGENLEKIAARFKLPLTTLREHIAHKLTERENKVNREPSHLPNFEGFKEPHFIEVTATRQLINGKIVDVLPSLINFD